MGSDKQDSVVLHLDDFEDLDDLNNAEAGKLLKAILAYVSTGALPDKLGVQAKTMFGYIRRHIDRDKTYYDEVKRKRSEAGKLGGRPKKSKENQKKQKVFEESKKSYPDPDPDPDPDTDPDPDPDTVAPPVGAPDGTSDSGQIEKRISFLRTMCRLFEAGALQDKEDYAMYMQELQELTDGVADNRR